MVDVLLASKKGWLCSIWLPLGEGIFPDLGNPFLKAARKFWAVLFLVEILDQIVYHSLAHFHQGWASGHLHS